MTDTRVSQVAAEVAEDAVATTRVAQVGAEVSRDEATTHTRVAQLAAEAVRDETPTRTRVSQLAVEVVRTPENTIPVPPGHMTWTGGLPRSSVVVDVPPGALTWTGRVPLVIAGTVVSVPPGHMTWTGQAPLVRSVASPAFNWRATVISQYQVSPIILRLVEVLNDYLDPAADFDAFFRLVWNVETAVGWGLDNWGRIVGVGRVLHVSTGTESFGWEEGGTTDYTGFGQAPFFGGGAVTSNFSLSDLNYRRLILAKAAANITDGSIPAINQILLGLFPGRGNCYATDGLDMTMTYTFEFALTPVEQAIVGQSGVLPKPVGVSVTVVTPP